MSPLLTMVIASVLYMAAGAFREILVVRYYGAVSGRRAWSASGLAGAIEGYDLLILAAIFRSGFHPVLMLAYTIGVVAGTFIGTRYSK